MAHLTLVLQGREVRKFVLNPTVTTIGRAQDNDIVINNLALSRRHAQVEFRGGRFEVSDLGSQNGVYVNSERVRASRALDDADTITLGTYHFVFNDSSSDPDVQAARKDRRMPAAQEVTEAPPRAREREASPEPEDHVPLLVLKYNEVELQRFALKNASCLIGRAKECDVQIPERRLSRKHCEIIRENGRYIAKDLGSQNGTYVNRKRIREQQELKHDDVLNFAEYSVHFLADVAEYDGPDLVHARRQAAQQKSQQRTPGPRPGSNIAAEETAFPEAYRNGGAGAYEADRSGAAGFADDHVHPSDMTDDPEVSHGGRMPMSMMPPRDGGKRARPDEEVQPLIEDPKHARERRKQGPPPPAVPTRAGAPARERAEGPNAVRVRGVDDGARSERSAPAERDRQDRADRNDRSERPERGGERGDRSGDRAERNDRNERGGERNERNEWGDRADRLERGGDERSERNERGGERDAPRKPGTMAEVAAAGRGGPKKGSMAPPPPRKQELEDVPDEQGERLPDPDLDEWYDARQERSEVLEEEDSSVLLRGKSSVSQILSTMMVDKKELDRNLNTKARQRRFFVDVRWGEEKIYSGPLKEQVTILGTDREADIQLKGRYVAGRHSILVRVKDSLLLVRLGSSSAARVNGLPKLQAFLKTGDVIQIDETTIKISED